MQWFRANCYDPRDVVTTNAATTLSVGTNPVAAAVNPVTNKTYVPNYHGHSVTVVDGATNAAATMAAGTYPSAVPVAD